MTEMPAKKTESFYSFMDQAEEFSKELRLHRDNALHIDPMFCPACHRAIKTEEQQQTYLNRSIHPTNPVPQSVKNLFAAREEFEFTYNEDGSIHHLTYLHTHTHLCPVGMRWEQYNPEETKTGKNQSPGPKPKPAPIPDEPREEFQHPVMHWSRDDHPQYREAFNKVRKMVPKDATDEEIEAIFKANQGMLRRARQRREPLIDAPEGMEDGIYPFSIRRKSGRATTFHGVVVKNRKVDLRLTSHAIFVAQTHHFRGQDFDEVYIERFEWNGKIFRVDIES